MRRVPRSNSQKDTEDVKPFSKSQLSADFQVATLLPKPVRRQTRTASLAGSRLSFSRESASSDPKKHRSQPFFFPSPRRIRVTPKTHRQTNLEDAVVCGQYLRDSFPSSVRKAAIRIFQLRLQMIFYSRANNKTRSPNASPKQRLNKTFSSTAFPGFYFWAAG